MGKAQQAPLSLENPIQHVEKISTVGRQTYERRPFTDAELRRLIAVSAYRSVVYLTAAHTGLRRKELSTLVWADVFLDLPNPHIVVQAKNAKNRKLQPLPLHPEVVAALKRLEEERRPAPTDRVFRGIFPKRETFRHDLKRAGIQNIEDRSGKLHFHSLRHTMNYRLQENGVVPTVAQHLMRHSSVNLTTKTYISSASLPLAEAIRRVPAIVPGLKTDTPIDTLKPVAHCHSVSQADTGSQNTHDPKILINKGSGHDFDGFWRTESQRGKWSGRQDSNSKPAPHNQMVTTNDSQGDSQSSKIFDSDLQRVINAWRDLPTNLKAAIMAIVGPDSLSHPRGNHLAEPCPTPTRTPCRKSRAFLESSFECITMIIRLPTFTPILLGDLHSKTALRLVREWIDLHDSELKRDWELARHGRPLENE
ncbi:MAG: tyrosine-type recombinase/integrase [Terrimicrobiaceae bacterium]